MTGGLIIDMDKMKKHEILQKDQKLFSKMSHGVLTRSGVAVGLAFDHTNKKCVVAYKPDINRMEIIKWWDDKKKKENI